MNGPLNRLREFDEESHRGDLENVAEEISEEPVFWFNAPCQELVAQSGA